MSIAVAPVSSGSDRSLVGPQSTEAELDAFVDALDARIGRLLGEIQRMDAWKVLMAPDTDPALVRAIMREVYLEIYSYQPHVIEATIAIIGRMPKADAKMIGTMLRHQAEEADHGEMALRDYVALGGDLSYARRRRISPASFAAASVWWGLWRMESPFAYLGALYPFEGLTPLVSQIAKARLEQADFPRNALEYIEFHATEDVKHAKLVRVLLKKVARQYEGAAAAILYGMECFLAVYPIPVWQTAYERASSAFSPDR